MQFFQIGQKLPAFFRNSSFKLPADPTKPVQIPVLSLWLSRSRSWSWLSLAGDHDRRWKWHRSVQKLLAGATASGRGRPSPFSTLIYFASLQFERILFPNYFLLEAQAGVSLGPMILAFGCRRESMDLLRKETDKLGCVFKILRTDVTDDWW